MHGSHVACCCTASRKKQNNTALLNSQSCLFFHLSLNFRAALRKLFFVAKTEVGDHLCGFLTVDWLPGLPLWQIHALNHMFVQHYAGRPQNSHQCCTLHAVKQTDSFNQITQNTKQGRWQWSVWWNVFREPFQSMKRMTYLLFVNHWR